MQRTLSLFGVSIVTSFLAGCVPASQLEEGEDASGSASTIADDDSTPAGDDDASADDDSTTAGDDDASADDDSTTAGDDDASADDDSSGAQSDGTGGSGSGASAGGDDDDEEGETGGDFVAGAGTGGSGAAHTGGNDSGVTGGSGTGGAGATSVGNGVGGLDSSGSAGTAAGTGGAESPDTSSGGAGNETGGSAGSGAADTVTADSCDGPEATANDTRDSATPYSLGTDFPACIQNADDVDYYEFTTPDDGNGGYVVVSLTEVGETGSMRLAIWSAADNGQIYQTYNYTSGASVYTFFNAAPGETYRVEARRYGGQSESYSYTLNAEYTRIADVYEPNDDRNHAAPISANESIEAYMSAGWVNSTEIPDEAWYDWYQVELATGDTTFLVSLLASDIAAHIALYDSIGSIVEETYNYNDGASAVFTWAIEEAGTYYVQVRPYSTAATVGATNNVPQYLTMPYTLTISQ